MIANEVARLSVNERAFEMVRRIRRTHGDLPLSAFKALVRDQFNMLLIDQEAALAAIPALLPITLPPCASVIWRRASILRR